MLMTGCEARTTEATAGSHRFASTPEQRTPPPTLPISTTTLPPQVTDTPGLLNREDGDRNAMERLTLASLQHLPTAVLFVADLTGECGTSVADQWRIRWVWGFGRWG